jgi:hypothetical protein
MFPLLDTMTAYTFWTTKSACDDRGWAHDSAVFRSLRMPVMGGESSIPARSYWLANHAARIMVPYVFLSHAARDLYVYMEMPSKR